MVLLFFLPISQDIYFIIQISWNRNVLITQVSSFNVYDIVLYWCKPVCLHSRSNHFGLVLVVTRAYVQCVSGNFLRHSEFEQLCYGSVLYITNGIIISFFLRTGWFNILRSYVSNKIYWIIFFTTVPFGGYEAKNISKSYFFSMYGS